MRPPTRTRHGPKIAVAIGGAVRWQDERVRVLVAVPALNEAATVADVVAQIRNALPADVLVVDDASSDNTSRVARTAGATVLRMPFNVGVGGAMRAAFLYAEQGDYDAVVQVDADGQHDPAQIPQLLEPLAAGASVVVGSRFARGYETARSRRLAMRTLAWGAGRLIGVQLTDTTSGFRAADRQAIALFARRYPAEYLGDTTESLVVAGRSGLRVVEVPVTMLPRQGGEASQRAGRSTLFVGRVLLALAIAALTRRDPVAT